MQENGDVTADDIVLLVDEFYKNVRKNPQLSLVFDRAIAEDEWKIHMQKMYEFWRSIMLGSREYHGNPMRVHHGLLPFDEVLFDEWLRLFSQTAQRLFQPSKAQQFIDKASRIAAVMRQNLFDPSPLTVTSSQ